MKSENKTKVKELLQYKQHKMLSSIKRVGIFDF